jgi:hypothetical protein
MITFLNCLLSFQCTYNTVSENCFNYASLFVEPFRWQIVGFANLKVVIAQPFDVVFGNPLNWSSL